MKRYLALALMSATMMAACGKKGGETPKPKPEPEPPEVVLPTLPGPPSGVPMRVVGYLPDWSLNCVRTGTLDWSALTHLHLAFVNPTNDAGDMGDNFSDADLVNIVTKAHAAGVKVLASLGGGGGGNGYAALISTAEKRAAFCAKIVEYITANDLDGVDLDLELGQGSDIWNYYGDFVDELRRLCDAEGLLLSTAVAQWFAGDISTSTLQTFDYVCVMAYDNESNGFENHSSYDFAEQSAEYFRTRGVEAGRVVLGIPFYGYPRNGTWAQGLGYGDILKQYPAASASDTAGPYTYNGPATVALKCRLATVYGGVMIWQLDHDATGTASLLKVIKDNI